MRILAMFSALLLGACAATAREPTPPPRVFAQLQHALLPDARSFALGASAPGIYPTGLGSWSQPLTFEGVVMHTGALEGGTLAVPVPEWLGMHEMVLRDGDRRLVLQYDAPAQPAPVRRGERVRIFAHSMLLGDRLAFGMSVYDQNGELAMAGLRAPLPAEELLPTGWSVTFGPPTQSSPLCDGTLDERTVRVRGPGGEAVVSPGWTSVAAIGPRGEQYAVDVVRARHADASCARAAEETGLSVVIRRLD